MTNNKIFSYALLIGSFSLLLCLPFLANGYADCGSYADLASCNTAEKQSCENQYPQTSCEDPNDTSCVTQSGVAAENLSFCVSNAQTYCSDCGSNNSFIAATVEDEGTAVPAQPTQPTSADTSTCDPNTQLCNPIGESHPDVIVANVIRAMLGVLGAVSLLMFIYGGFLLVFSHGEEEKIKKGRGTLIWAIIGMAIILSSYSILSYLFKAITTSMGV